jgi:hypothetical protein
VLKDDLISIIEKKRAELIHVVSLTGLTSNAAIRHSQELDELINMYQRDYINKVYS